jgi:transposase-like protein
MRPYMMMSGTSYRIDETYVKVGREWKYLYRAVDSAGSTIEFMLSAKRDISAAKRFFKKMMRADHRLLPFIIGTDKHASYPEAFAASVKEKVLSCHTAERTIEGIEAMHVMRKGQVKRLDGRDAGGQARLVASLFGVAA